MYGFGLVGVLVVFAIVGFVFMKPQLSMLPSAAKQQEQQTGISGAREICMTSARAAYLMDLQIAGVQCPRGADTLPDASCVQGTGDGARAYAKYVSAERGCGQQ